MLIKHISLSKGMVNKNMLCDACNVAFVGIAILDRNFRIIEVNREILKKGKVEENEVVGTSFLKYLPCKDKDKMIGILKRVRDRGVEESMITQIKSREGWIWVMALARPFKNTILVNLIDITKALQTEIALEEEIQIEKTLEEAIQDAVMVINEDGKITSWNSSAEKIFGFKKDEILGKKVWKIIPEQFIDEYKKIFLENIDTNKGERKSKLITILAKDKDGKEIPVELSIGKVKIGKKWSFIVVARNITSRIEREKELEREKDELTFLYKFLNKISSTLDLESIFEMAYVELKKILPKMDAFLVALIDDKKDKINVEFVVGEGKKYEKHSIPFNDKDTLAGWVATHEKELYVKKVNNGNLPAGIRKVGAMMNSWVGIPLKYHGKTFGVLSVQSKEDNAFTERDMRILRIVSDNFAMVIANAEMYGELKVREEMYSSIVNTNIVGMATTDTNMVFKFVNEYFAEMLGYKPEEMIGKHLKNFTTEKGFKDMEEGTKRRLASISDSYESEFVKKDGTVIPVLVYASPIKNIKGEVVGTVGIILDITERKKMEERIKEEREKYKILFENVATGIAVIQDKRIVYANKEMARMLGYEPIDIIGERVDKFIHPHYVKMMLVFYDSRLRDLSAPHNYIAQLITKSGVAIWCEIKASKIDWEGKIAVMGSVTDITHIKETEDTIIALERIAREIKNAKNVEEVLKIVSDGINSILHFTRVKIVTKKNYIETSKIENARDFKKNSEDLEIIKLVWEKAKSYYDEKYIENTGKIESIYAIPITARGKVYAVLAVSRIAEKGITTEEKMMIDMLASHMGATIDSILYQKELESSKNLQELMLHIVSHDLKNPLAVIEGYTELLRDECKEEYLNEIKNALDNGIKIIERARLFSRLDMKKVHQEIERMNIRAIVEKAYRMIREKYPKSELVVKGETEIDAYPIIEEVFVNLLDNAYKYGAKVVMVTINAENENVEIKVADDGVGIPEGQKEIIFEAFERISKRGSGLGLAIVKKIIELHSGTIEVVDNKPRGSIFIINLPTSMKDGKEQD